MLRRSVWPLRPKNHPPKKKDARRDAKDDFSATNHRNPCCEGSYDILSPRATQRRRPHRPPNSGALEKRRNNDAGRRTTTTQERLGKINVAGGPNSSSKPGERSCHVHSSPRSTTQRPRSKTLTGPTLLPFKSKDSQLQRWWSHRYVAPKLRSPAQHGGLSVQANAPA